ncbi:hypothetical protein L3Q82_005147 [Scortum barcoo]|uniref:Uncharacterized protein n=1 Tax=Scortum barcoo TaxID=214431 RepID=A0ACB8VED4_9TELE|nr:hypothetical protein L3Q82_005147 [Scortum barcoo]
MWRPAPRIHPHPPASTTYVCPHASNFARVSPLGLRLYPRHSPGRAAEDPGEQVRPAQYYPQQQSRLQTDRLTVLSAPLRLLLLKPRALDGAEDFRFCSQSCHLQKFSDDSAIVGCITRGLKEGYRSVVDRFVEWYGLNHLQLNVTKTKELVVDFRKQRTLSVNSVTIRGTEVDIVDSYKLRSFNVMLHMFYYSVVSSVIFYAVVCWGSRLKTADTNRLNKFIRRAGSVLGFELESVAEVS